jgi:hypothetical protein
MVTYRFNAKISHVASTRAYFTVFGPLKNYKTIQYMSLEINRGIWPKEKFENMVGCVKFG